MRNNIDFTNPKSQLFLEDLPSQKEEWLKIFIENSIASDPEATIIIERLIEEGMKEAGKLTDAEKLGKVFLEDAIDKRVKTLKEITETSHKENYKNGSIPAEFAFRFSKFGVDLIEKAFGKDSIFFAKWRIDLQRKENSILYEENFLEDNQKKAELLSGLAKMGTHIPADRIKYIIDGATTMELYSELDKVRKAHLNIYRELAETKGESVLTSYKRAQEILENTPYKITELNGTFYLSGTGSLDGIRVEIDVDKIYLPDFADITEEALRSQLSKPIYSTDTLTADQLKEYIPTYIKIAEKFGGLARIRELEADFSKDDDDSLCL